MATQQFCLKWNNHTNNLVKTFGQLLDDQHFVDVTLACEKSSLKAHKVVLSACSSYFRDLFLENPCKHPIVILKDMRFQDLKSVVDFMYCGEVNVPQNQLTGVLKTAEILQVKGLTEVHDKQEVSADNNFITVNNESVTNDSASLHIATETSLLSPQVTKRQRKRKNRLNLGDRSNNESSANEDSSDEEAVKKLKNSRNINENAKNVQAPESLLANIHQWKRKITTQLFEQNNKDSQDTSEKNNQNNQIALRILPNEDEDEDSDDMYDLKPIVTFGESPGNNSTIGAHEDSLLSTDGNVPGPSNSHTGKICVCHLCHLTFTAYSSLRRHMARHFADRERYECEICLKSYSRKDYLKEHKKLKHST